MSDALTSNKLINSIQRRASIPSNQSTFSPEDFLELATEELWLGIVPTMMELHEDFFLFEQEIPFDSQNNTYEIPSRAVGNKLRDVQLKYGGNYAETTRVGIGTRFSENEYSVYSGLTPYYIKNNKVVFPKFTSAPQSTTKIVMVFYIKASKLVLEEKVGVISGINFNTGEVVLSNIPEDFNTNIQYDFYKADSPHTILRIDLSAANVNFATKSVTFNPEDLPSELKVGDHLAKAGECMIPQVPTEMQIMLTQMVACRILESIGDTDGLQNALVKLKQMQTAAGVVIDNRVEDSPPKIVNRHGIVRTSVYSKRLNRR